MRKINWEDILQDKIKLLGHRNWIVITDMAYPLQAGSGITTFYASETYEAVLSKVKQMIDNEPHIFAHIYNDAELQELTEEDIVGIDAIRDNMNEITGDGVLYEKHENLIRRLDEASKLFNVIIIKTPLTMAYTSTFFELDCAYWDDAHQKRLDAKMAKRQAENKQ